MSKMKIWAGPLAAKGTTESMVARVCEEKEDTLWSITSNCTLGGGECLLVHLGAGHCCGIRKGRVHWSGCHGDNSEVHGDHRTLMVGEH